MATLALVLSVVMLVSTGLLAALAAKDGKLKTALSEVTVDPDKEYECLLFRLEDKLDRLEKRLTKVERKLKNQAPHHGFNATQYAFSASLSTSSKKYSGTLKFTGIADNVGGAYNQHTGAFTAAVDGVYVFSFHGSVYSNSQSCHLHLYHQNKIVARAFAYDPNGRPSVSNTAVLKLNKTDRVRVQASSNCYLYGQFSSFSGFMLPK